MIHGVGVLFSVAQAELDLVPGKEGRLPPRKDELGEVWAPLRSVGRSMARPPLRIEDLCN